MPCPAQNLHTEVPGLAVAAQHHSPGRSQLILNPQLGDLSSQPVWQVWGGGLAPGQRLHWEPLARPPSDSLHQLAHTALLPEMSVLFAGVGGYVPGECWTPLRVSLPPPGGLGGSVVGGLRELLGWT